MHLAPDNALERTVAHVSECSVKQSAYGTAGEN